MRVLLVDDHRLIVEALSGLLSAYGHEVAGIASDGREALTLAEELQPDLILMDLSMPVCDGLTATRMIKARLPEQRIVILTTSAEDADLFAAIQSGACGYLLKSTSGAAFVEALAGLQEGIPPFSPGLASRLLQEFARLAPTTGQAQSQMPERPATVQAPVESPNQLTGRQTEVLRLVASGLTYGEVGRALSIGERTVRYHMAEIMDRLHLQHRSQVIAWAGQQGLGPRD